MGVSEYTSVSLTTTQQIITTVDSTATTFLEKTNSKVTGTRFNRNVHWIDWDNSRSRSWLLSSFTMKELTNKYKKTKNKQT